MKVSQIRIVLLATIVFRIGRSDGNKPQQQQQRLLRRRRTATATATADNGLLQTYGKIISGDSRIDACIEVPTTDYHQVHKQLILGDCQQTTGSSGWRFDSKGQIHSQYNDEYCIQAAALHDGARLKLLPCDNPPDSIISHNTINPLQQFIYHNHGEAIRPKSDDKLCVTFEGNHPDIGRDKIILRKCQDVEHQRHWIGAFPRATDNNNQNEKIVPEEEGLAR